MKHLAIIQIEFLKQARQWRDLSYNAQRQYLQEHPKSKKRQTAIPEILKIKEKQMPEVGDRVVVMGDWQSYGDSSYEADVVEIQSNEQVIVRDDAGRKSIVPMTRLELKYSTKGCALAASG